MDWLVGLGLLITAGCGLAYYVHRQKCLHELLESINAGKIELRNRVEEGFLIQPCPRCHESKSKLLEISPNGRSVHYQCTHCKKKSHAAAGSPKSVQAINARKALDDLVERYNGMAGQSGRIVAGVFLAAPPAPLPYEQTKRMPITEAVRSEVWRRDGGGCVQCGSNQNLQFDHMIPVAKGGATTVANLQLLCQPCNGAKGKKI